METSAGSGDWHRRNAYLVQLGMVLLAGTAFVCLVLGILAAIVGSSLASLGSGPGGLAGAPLFVFTFVLLISVPSLLLGAADMSKRRRIFSMNTGLKAG